VKRGEKVPKMESSQKGHGTTGKNDKERARNKKTIRHGSSGKDKREEIGIDEEVEKGSNTRW